MLSIKTPNKKFSTSFFYCKSASWNIKKFNISSKTFQKIELISKTSLAKAIYQNDSKLKIKKQKDKIKIRKWQNKKVIKVMNNLSKFNF